MGQLFIADTKANRIVGIDSLGRYYLVAGDIAGKASFADGIDTLAKFNNPMGIVSDGVNLLYVADQLNNRVRKIDLLNHTVVTIAGNGIFGFAGDDSLAINANLANPTGVGIDRNGNVFIADTYNNRLRMVDSFGFIHTLAGDGNTGINESAALGLSCNPNRPLAVTVAPDNTVIVSDSYNNRVRVLDKNGNLYTIAGIDNDTIPGYYGDSIPSNLARLSMPVGLAVDTTGGYLTLFIADANNNRIRMVSFLSPLTWPKNSIDGRVATTSGNVVSGVNILANGQQLAIIDTFGLYHIRLDSGFVYNIVPTPSCDSVKTNGVDVIDILQEINYILGKSSCLNSPYSLLAGDVNGDSTIDVLDLLLMKRFILGVDTAFQYPTKGSVLWVFVDSNYVFQDPSKPWGRNDTIWTKADAGNVRKCFVAIKLGDVDGSWSLANNQKAKDLPSERSMIKRKGFKDGEKRGKVE